MALPGLQIYLQNTTTPKPESTPESEITRLETKIAILHAEMEEVHIEMIKIKQQCNMNLSRILGEINAAQIEIIKIKQRCYEDQARKHFGLKYEIVVDLWQMKLRMYSLKGIKADNLRREIEEKMKATGITVDDLIYISHCGHVVK